jgi:hypothetical protein
MALKMGGASSFIDILKHAFWTDNALSGITLFRFVGEFKCASSSKNFNQLLMDFATGQCQLRGLGIREVIWGATYSLGVVEVFSSEWNINGSVSNVSSFVPSHFAYLDENNSRTLWSIVTKSGT